MRMVPPTVPTEYIKYFNIRRALNQIKTIIYLKNGPPSYEPRLA